jgi:hypothetical protein
VARAKKTPIPKTGTWYGKQYTLHGVYPSFGVAENHAIYLRAGALFQGTFLARIRKIDDSRYAVYKRRVRTRGAGK